MPWLRTTARPISRSACDEGATGLAPPIGTKTPVMRARATSSVAGPAELHLTDVEELYDVRLALEVQAARLAAQRAGGGVAMGDLGRALAEADAMLSGGDEAAIAEANASVHDRILDMAGNRLLSSIVRPVVGRDRWIFGMISAQRNAFRTCREHHQLCGAIFSGDVELAVGARLRPHRGRSAVDHRCAEVDPARLTGIRRTATPSRG